jgi:hypothetical protein
VLSTARRCDYRTSIYTEDYEVGDSPLKEPTIRPSKMARRHPRRLCTTRNGSGYFLVQNALAASPSCQRRGLLDYTDLENHDNSLIYKETRCLLEHKSGPAGAFIQRTSTHSALFGARRQPVDAFTETAWISFRLNHALRIG